MRQIYGAGLTYGACLFVFSPIGLGGAITYDRYTKSGTPIIIGSGSATSTIDIHKISANAVFRGYTPSSVVAPYFGAGLVVNFVSEELSASSGGLSASASGSMTVFGGQALVGIEWHTGVVVVAIEARYMLARGSGGQGAMGSQPEFGGFTLSLAVQSP